MGKLENRFEIDGEVVLVGEVDYFTPKFSKRTVVVRVFKGRFLEPVPFDFINRDMDQVDGISVGDQVIVNFQVGGRENKNRAGQYFPSIQGIEINLA